MGGEKKKKNEKKINKKESDNHVVAAFSPPEDATTGCTICNQTKASSSVKAFLQLRGGAKKASPVVRGRGGLNEGLMSPPLRGNSHRIEGAVPAVEL